MPWRVAYSRASRGGVAGAGSRALGVDKTDCEDVAVDNAQCELLRGGHGGVSSFEVGALGFRTHEGVDMTER
jgi:hypothetical protein